MKPQIALKVVPKSKFQTRIGSTVLIEMTPAEWAAVEDCVCQRNTEQHALRIEDHLQTLMPEHRQVNAFIFPDGTLMKANGHTRSLLWEKKRIPVPESILVIAEPCERDNNAIRARYLAFDNMNSVETRQDLVVGSIRMNGVKFKSAYLRSGRFSSGMSPASPRSVPQDMHVIYWEPELLAIDPFDPTNKDFPGPVLAAWLVTARARGIAEALKFWSIYMDKNGGTFANGKYSPDFALKTWINHKKKKGWGNASSTKLMRSVALGVFEAWYNDRSTQFTQEQVEKLEFTHQMGFAEYKTAHSIV